jgi:hypothetical protein
MKNLITIILFIFISNLSFGQIQAVKAGNYYELNDLWKRDSISVKQLMDTYKLDISNLIYVKFFGDFELSQELHDNYSYTTYVYALDKKTGVVTMESIPHVKKIPKPNKYVMVYCFDNYTDSKIINIKVF